MDIEDSILLEQEVAISSDFNHSSDSFFFDVQRLKAEVGELFWEVMLRNWNHSEVRSLLWWCVLRELKVGWDHILKLLFGFLKSFLHDDLVHGSGKVLVHLVHDTSSIDILAGFQVARGSGHMDDSTDLLRIKFREFFWWHVVNEEVVSDLGVSEDSLLMGLSHSLSEDSWVLRVEEKIDSREFNILAGHVPLTAVYCSLLVPRLDEYGFPFTGAIIILEETLSWNWSNMALLVDSELDPLLWETAIILEIIEWFEWKPISLIWRWVSVIYSKLKKKLLDIERCKKLSLTIDNDLSWWFTGDRQEWLHDLWVWIGNSFSFSRVEPLVDIWVSEVVLADDFDLFGEATCFSLGLLSPLCSSGFDAPSSWNSLLSVCFDQVRVLWTRG